MRNEKPIDMRRIEELESKELLTYRMSQMIHPQ